MTKEDEREVQRKLRILQHTEKIGHVARTCCYFGIGRASFYRWKAAYERDGEDGLVNAKTIPKNPPNQTPPEIVEKVLHLRRKYHLGPERIMWYLARYHSIKLSDATIYRILKRNGLNRLPRGTRLRKVHTKRYNKQVPGHHIQMDVKFLTFIGKKGEKTRRFQYTAIDDGTRVRALKVYKKHTQGNAACTKAVSQCAMDMSSRPSSTGMSKTLASAMRISNAVRLSSMVKSSDHTALICRGFTSC